MNVIGDVGLVVGAFLLFDATGALDYAGVFEGAQNAFVENDGQLVAACICLLVGAFAKSAQIPLHTWLPDAMEGPTPVSALIHAATMVTAGVYLIARMHPLFELAPAAADVAAIDRHAHAVRGGDDRAGRHRPEARHRLLDDVADRLHGARRLGVRVRRGAVPPDDARVLQGAALHGRRLGDRGDGRRRSRSTGWAASARRCRSRSSRSRSARSRWPASRSSSGFFSKDEILAFTLNRGGLYTVLGVVALRRRAHDRVLRVPDGVPRVLRRAGRGGARARAAGTSRTTIRRTR